MKSATGIFLWLSIASSACWASYAQFCRFEGDIVSTPSQDGCCVEFEYLVHAAESYEDEIFGEGWGDCDAVVGDVLTVRIVLDFLGKSEFREGQRRTVWRDAVDMEVNGEMCTVVGFSAVNPAVKNPARSPDTESTLPEAGK